jgi:hypothetical protein
MIIGSCTITLYIPTAHSLKEKRSAVKSIIARVRNEFNVSIAEVDAQEVWQRAVIGVACVSSSDSYARGQLEAVLRFIEEQRPDLPVLDHEIELL